MPTGKRGTGDGELGKSGSALHSYYSASTTTQSISTTQSRIERVKNNCNNIVDSAAFWCYAFVINQAEVSRFQGPAIKEL
jgi:hypothetical protein